MRVEAHQGPRPLRKVAFSSSIIAFTPDPSTMPQIPGGVRTQHVTVCYLDNGDSDGQRTNAFVSKIAMQPRTSPVEVDIISGTKDGDLLMFKLLDDWYGKFAKFMVDTLAKNNIQAGLGKGVTHLALAYGHYDRLAQVSQELNLAQWQGVTLNGPFVYNANGQQLPKPVTSSVLPTSDDWLELALLTQDMS